MLKQLNNPFPNISLRIDKKLLIAKLRATQNNYIELLINSNDLKTIYIKDRKGINSLTTEN